MYAVFRESSYAPDKPIYESQEFQEFQREHASRHGYGGTIVVELGDGRYLTVTLWDSAQDMNSARASLVPVVERLLNPLMTKPSTLHGTGRVVVNDLMASTEHLNDLPKDRV